MTADSYSTATPQCVTLRFVVTQLQLDCSKVTDLVLCVLVLIYCQSDITSDHGKFVFILTVFTSVRIILEGECRREKVDQSEIVSTLRLAALPLAGRTVDSLLPFCQTNATCVEILFQCGWGMVVAFMYTMY
jgi:hypothetical protein